MSLKTSIILCTYNEANYIENTIAEIEKIIENLELIIVDDNSTDGTKEIINKIPNPKFIEATTVIGVLNHIIIALDGAPNMLAAISFGINIKTNNRIPTKICNIPIILSINVGFIIIGIINIFSYPNLPIFPQKINSA